uniref:non-specific serine/threonine protein kinase n=1 Tax=Plectus sambesii TaxID=2011161 RepID=A0A914VG32_9BILA
MSWNVDNTADRQVECDSIAEQIRSWNWIVGGQYRLVDMMGKGSFANVYSAVNITDEADLVAVKISHERSEDTLVAEAKVYDKLFGLKGIPRTRMYVKERRCGALVMDLLGPSLGNLKDYCGHFSLKTVFMLADQMISRLASLHSRGYIHGDLKEDNFILGRQETIDERTVYLVDFGLAKTFLLTNGEHIAPKTGLNPCGTLRYTSLNCTLGNEISRRDDIESLGYLLIYLHRGDLPWILAESVVGGDEKRRLMADIKLHTPVKKLCEGLPDEFFAYITYCRSLRFDEQPDYARLRLLCEVAMHRLDYEIDGIFDWTIRLRDDLEWKRLLALEDVF